ncbi:MAG: porin family protein [Colwellia sp.]|nr:porin family protein [Colwellia sp.]
MLRIIFLSFFISSVAIADESIHKIGLEYSYSEISNGSDKKTSELNDLITSHYAYSYQYKVSEHFSMGLGYVKGDSSNADGILIDIFTDSKIDYSALLISAAVNYPLSKRNSLYVKVNVLQYDYDIVDDNAVIYSQDGNDFSFSLGWMFEFHNGFSIKAGYETLNLGEHITIKGFNTGISYRF